MAASSLGVRTHFVPHSARHGGATRDFLAGVAIDDIRFRGRWKNSKSVLRYVQTWRALITAQKVPARVTRFCEVLSLSAFEALSLAAFAAHSSP